MVDKKEKIMVEIKNTWKEIDNIERINRKKMEKELQNFSVDDLKEWLGGLKLELYYLKEGVFSV